MFAAASFTTTNMPKEWKMSLMEIRETWIKMTSKEERGRTFGVAAFVLGIAGFVIPYLPLPFLCFPASVALGVNTYKCGQRRWGGAVIMMGVIGILGFLFIMVSALRG
jgi:hypothetical protein